MPNLPPDAADAQEEAHDDAAGPAPSDVPLFVAPDAPGAAPLGATPTLPPLEATPPPSSERVMELFTRVMARGQAARRARAVESAPPPAFGGGRRYDLALALLRGEDTQVSLPSAAGDLLGDAVTAGLTPAPSAEPEADEVTRTLALPSHPPLGAPVVRPPLREKKGAHAVPQGLLADAADSVLLVHDPDGATSFDIAVSDELFDALSCRITLRDKRVVATFQVRDANTRRLLEAEAGRLRVQLEGRGLTVDEVRVVEMEEGAS